MKFKIIGKKIFLFKTRKKFRKVRKTKSNYPQYKKSKEEARIFITKKVLYFNQFYKFEYNKIFIKNQKTKWGSCSSKKNLNFNYKLLFIPEELADLVIVHELCHLKELNHSKNFWDMVAETIPDWREKRAKIKQISI